MEHLVELLKTASTSQVSLAEGLQRLGQAYEESGRIREAVTAYQRSLEANPDNAEMMNRLAWLLLTVADPEYQDPPQALQLAQRAAELVPLNGNYFNTLGVAHYRSGEFAEAARVLRHAIKLQRNEGTPYDWFFLAMSLAKDGDVATARSWQRRAEQWCEEHKEFAEDLRRIYDECASVLD